MTERNAEIIRLHTVEKLSFGQIAQRLGITRSVVAGVLDRANVKNARDYPQPSVSIGRRFGRLEALYPTKERYRSSGSIVWRCLCDCGEYCKVPSHSLLSGVTRSCGCLRRETARRTLAVNRRKREMVA